MRGSVLLFVLAGCGRLSFDANDSQSTADAAPGTPTLSVATSSTLTDETAGTIAIPLVLSQPTTQTVTARWSQVGGTATDGDYIGTPIPAITIPPGETTGMLELTIVDDGVAEASESIELELASPVGAVLGDRTHRVTISANALPRVSFSVASSTMAESAGAVVFVELSSPSIDTVSVKFAVEGSAIPEVDHSRMSGTLFLPPGSTSKPISIDIINDTIDEDSETVTLTLAEPDGAVIGTIDTFTHTIADDDAEPSIQFVASLLAQESDGATGAALTLSSASSRTITVPFVVNAASTATAGDYMPIVSPIVIAPGNTVAMIPFTIIDDSLTEGSENLLIDLQTPTNATLGAQSSFTCIIQDND